MATKVCEALAKRLLMAERPAISTLSALSPSVSSSAAAISMAGMQFPVQFGRGDKKTKKGKRFKGSYGNSRPKKEKMIQRIKDKVEVPRSTPWPLPFKLI